MGSVTINYRNHMQPVRAGYMAARLNDEDGLAIQINMFTAEQRAWLVMQGISVSTWYGQPSLEWEFDERAFIVFPDTFAWVISCGPVDRDMSHTLGAAPTLVGALHQVALWRLFPVDAAWPAGVDVVAEAA